MLGGVMNRTTAPALLLLVLLTGAAFLPVKDADFIGYDDVEYVVSNPHVLRGLDLAGLRWALTSLDAGNWHPLTWASHMLDVSLFGLNPGAHHLTNLALHTLAAALLLLALSGLTGAPWPSFFVAALFAIHPLHVESVAWVAERKDVLSGLFAMLTLLLYLRYLRQPGRSRYLAVLGAFALGLMAKPMLVTLPFALLLLDWWPLNRFGRGGEAASPTRVGWRLFFEKVPLLALAAVSSVLTYIAQQRGGAMTDTDFFPLAARVDNALVSYVKYVGKMLWPRDLIYFYPHPLGTLPRGQVALCLLLLAAITAVAVAGRRRRPWLLTGWLWFAGTLVPVIGIVQVGRQAMADRYSYLPLIGLFAALTWEARSRVRHASPRAAGALAGGAAALLALLAGLTFVQAGYWQDTQRLSNHLLAIDPRNYVAYNLQGMDRLLRHEPAQAAPLLRTALALSPDYHEARYNLGLALAQLGQTDEALLQFGLVVRARPRDAEALYNLGLQFVRTGRLAEALDVFSRAAALEPRVARIQHDIGRTLDALGRSSEAVPHYLAALDLDPGDAEIHNDLGVTLAEQGRTAEALVHFAAAVRLAPDYREARENLDRARGSRAEPAGNRP
jgi:tetratricopeptide (TPR) repeat protein